MKKTINKNTAKDKNQISKVVLERLPLYLNFLHELDEEFEYISSATIAKELNLGEVLVRKDLQLVSSKPGKPKLGYVKEELCDDIAMFLGCHSITNAVIVGVGKIGRAILGYEGFTRYGVDILAGFSHHANKSIDVKTDKEILPLEMFESYCRDHDVKIGIITVPVDYAQEICDMMVRCGIKGIWNFARTSLSVPNDVTVRQEDLAASIAILACKLKNI